MILVSGDSPETAFVKDKRLEVLRQRHVLLFRSDINGMKTRLVSMHRIQNDLLKPKGQPLLSPHKFQKSKVLLRVRCRQLKSNQPMTFQQIVAQNFTHIRWLLVNFNLSKLTTCFIQCNPLAGESGWTWILGGIFCTNQDFEILLYKVGCVLGCTSTYRISLSGNHPWTATESIAPSFVIDRNEIHHQHVIGSRIHTK